ncbi:hypothetical protein BJ741DRAFT_668577 [Chytriomyces cf. hyalinus JEL632]|nr:hypothetical protein BJ741DRAFT_668577 [Chytriomyces cf. hyalinus JEL632]
MRTDCTATNRKVLKYDLTFARHVVTPVIAGPTPSFFPLPDLVVASTSKYYTVSSNKVEKPLNHSETHFHTFKPLVQRSATPTQGRHLYIQLKDSVLTPGYTTTEISDKPACHHKKPKQLSHGQKLAAASKHAKAGPASKP